MWRVVLLSAAVLCGVGTTTAATLRVPDEYPTIQAGIDAAVPGDTVLVADGNYSGPGNYGLNFLGKDLVCRSENGPEHTIIDAYHRGFCLANGETEASVIEGFTITRGCSEFPGAGIYLAGVSPRIVNCLIAGNESGGTGISRGGGIACVSHSQPTIVGCTITGNMSFPDLGPCPGGLFCDNSTVVVLDRCVLWGNYVQDVLLRGGSTVIVSCCCVDPEKLIIEAGSELIFDGESVFADPLLCSPPPYAPPWEADPADPDDYKLWGDSPCLPDVSPCGSLIGALPIGCPAGSVWPGDELPRLVLSHPPSCPSVGVVRCDLALREACRVRIAIYDVGGALVSTVLDQWLAAGAHPITWRCADAASGVYILEARAGDERQARRLLIVR